MSDTVAVEAVAHSRKRLRRIPEEERRIVEATFVPGASIARVAREHGVNANQVFQWRYEYRRGNQGVRQQGQSRLVPVTVTAEPGSVMGPEVAPVRVGSGSIHIELPGRASISVEAGVDPELVRTVFGEPIARPNLVVAAFGVAARSCSLPASRDDARTRAGRLVQASARQWRD